MKRALPRWLNPFRPAVPRTHFEWQAAVDVANLLLLLELGRRWGMVDRDGCVNVARCEEILSRGKDQFVNPRTPGPAGTGVVVSPRS